MKWVVVTGIMLFSVFSWARGSQGHLMMSCEGKLAWIPQTKLYLEVLPSYDIYFPHVVTFKETYRNHEPEYHDTARIICVWEDQDLVCGGGLERHERYRLSPTKNGWTLYEGRVQYVKPVRRGINHIILRKIYAENLKCKLPDRPKLTKKIN